MKYLHVLLVLGFLAFQSAVAQVTISEIMARNTSYIFNTESYNFDDWVEISNLGSSAQNLGGMYLSDDKTQPQKWAFPTYTLSAKSVFVVWFGSDNQIFGRPGFKLKSEGGSLYIYRNTGVLVDSVRYPAQYPNISWGKGSDNVWGYFQKPTAFNLNNLASYLSFAGSITASETAGRYSGSISVSLTAPAGNEIRYTIDGAEPRANSTLYSGPIWVGKTQVIRARCFAPNKLPGDLYTATYFIGEHDFSLPVVSVCTDPRYLWNDTVGIHVWGKNGIEGNCVGLANFNRDWERPFVVEHFEPQGKRNFVVHAKGEIGGGCSRSSHDMKSLNFDMSSKYGDKSLNFPLFKSKKLPAYKSFMLRNSGNDVNVTQMRDAFLQTLIEGVTEIDHLAYQPATMYLNGEYRGIMNIRERSDADYLMANYGLDTDQVDMVSINNFVNVVAGSEMPYKNLLETLTSMDMSSAAAYQFLDDNIDLPEYINYLVTQIYLANTDWPGNNTKAWRAHKAGAKWRWILYDLDFGAGIWDGPSDHRTLDFVTESNGPNWPNPPVSTLLIRKALESPKFKERFIQCFYTQIDNTFNLTRVNHVCDSLRNNILTEMPFHKQRWGGSVADMDWELNKMRDWFRRRNEFLPDYIRQFFGLNSPTNVLIKNTAPKMGKLWFNEAIVTTPEMSTQATTGLRVSFRAQANTGYAFDKWNIKHQEITALQFVKRGDSWAYWDKGTMPTNWQQPEFDASTWAVGNAQFGYGESDEATVLSFGTNSSQKYPTSYFRKEFKVDAPTTLSDLKLQILCDDGVLVYLNGVEVGRIN
ncbi:MAG: hypothetical protein RIS47_2043, partial [Bacteroidota bacterium]